MSEAPPVVWASSSPIKSCERRDCLCAQGLAMSQPCSCSQRWSFGVARGKVTQHMQLDNDSTIASGMLPCLLVDIFAAPHVRQHPCTAHPAIAGACMDMAHDVEAPVSRRNPAWRGAARRRRVYPAALNPGGRRQQTSAASAAAAARRPRCLWRRRRPLPGEQRLSPAAASLPPEQQLKCRCG